MSLVEYGLFTIRPQLNECYRTAARENPKLEADLIFAVSIDGNGHVTDVNPTVREGTTDLALTECATRALKSARFRPPADSGPVTVKVPIVFRPPPDAGVRDSGISDARR